MTTADHLLVGLKMLGGLAVVIFLYAAVVVGSVDLALRFERWRQRRNRERAAR